MFNGKYPESKPKPEDEKSFDEFADWIGVDKSKPKKKMEFKRGKCALPS